jgi:hypothetical protein
MDEGRGGGGRARRKGGRDEKSSQRIRVGRCNAGVFIVFKLQYKSLA